MYIKIKKNGFIHWWGKNIVLIIENSYYKLEDEEVFLIKYLLKNNRIEKAIDNIKEEILADENEHEKETIERFVKIFMENYSEVFEYSEVQQPALEITGEENQYYPFEIHVSLTSKCFQKCKHCYKNADVHGLNVEFDKLAVFLERMKKNTPFLTLSGGEPLMHPQVQELLNKFGDDYNICVMSSGYDIKDEMLNILNEANRGLWVSIYSSVANIHDEFVGVKGSYEKIMKNIKRCVSQGISVCVTTFLTEDNEIDIIELINRLLEENVKNITVSTIANIGRAKENGIVKNYEDGVRCSSEKIKNMFGDRVDVQINTNEASKCILSPFKCMAGSLLWCVHENGNIYPCGINADDELKMGTISDYNECVNNIEHYYNRISNVAILKKFSLSGGNCPFTEE